MQPRCRPKGQDGMHHGTFKATARREVIAGHVLERAGLVILPEFQGLGIGPKLSEFVIQVC